MSVEDILKNGQIPQGRAVVTTSWSRDEYASGRKRFTLHAIHVPVLGPADKDLQPGVSHPRLAAMPMVIGEVVMEVPNLEVAKMLYAAIGEMLSKQPPEIYMPPTPR
jgi:hypothetical protein